MPAMPTRNIDNTNISIALTASEFNGLSERSDRVEIRELIGVDPVRTEWCAAFVNAILSLEGIPGSDSVSEHPLTARSFLRWGVSVDTPQIGDVVVFPRGNSSWQGHVGFYIDTVERDGREYYIILGGNQSNRVGYDYYLASYAIDIRRYVADDTINTTAQ
jgi:uncharacterized protein (TIGR02594 family)